MKNKVFFASLGCDKNLTNSEEMLGMLLKEGYTFTDDETQADIIIVNTCAFINDAKEESINTILDMAEYKKEGKGVCKALVVTGCLAQRYKSEIIKEIPEADAVIGTGAYDDIVVAVKSALNGRRFENYENMGRLIDTGVDRVITTGGYYSYLKIAEGCDKRCTYCIIPQLRGKYKSVPMEKLISEAEYLASRGVRELILIAQETTLYGVDIYGKKSLHILLKKLAAIPGIKFIRIMYCYPEEIYDELIAVMKNEKKICHYIDMPIQHCNDEILKRMGRKANKARIVETVSRLRREIPDIIIRTTIISGFPGESDEQHAELLEFIDEVEFDRLGVFTYSPEEDTIAAGMSGQLDEKIKNDRRSEIMELQQEISADRAERMTGMKLEVMIEGKIPDENVYVGRSYMDAPDIDGSIFINTDDEYMSGDFVNVKIVKSLEYDYIGEIEMETEYENEFAK